MKIIAVHFENDTKPMMSSFTEDKNVDLLIIDVSGVYS
jgi:hypothetical protein